MFLINIQISSNPNIRYTLHYHSMAKKYRDISVSWCYFPPPLPIKTLLLREPAPGCPSPRCITTGVSGGGQEAATRGQNKVHCRSLQCTALQGTAGKCSEVHCRVGQCSAVQCSVVQSSVHTSAASYQKSSTKLDPS